MRINSSQKKAKIGGGCSTKGDYTLKKKMENKTHNEVVEINFINQ